MPSRSSLTLGRFIDFLAADLRGDAEAPWDFKRWLEWPPDVFALTTLIFDATGSYRYAVSPPAGCRLPHQSDWEKYVAEVVGGWRKWLDDSAAELPDRLEEIAELLRERHDFQLDRLREIDRPPTGMRTVQPFAVREEVEVEAWELFQALLDLHCFADSISAGYGIPLHPAPPGDDGWSPRYFLANMLLTTRGSLSRLPPTQVVVLPKMRTPRVGITLRSLSHHLAAHRTEVEVIWRNVPWISRDENVLNFVVVPWPYVVPPESFQPVPLSESFGSRGGRFFRYSGPKGFQAEQVVRLIREAEKRVRRVHAVVLPELALTEKELNGLKAVLAGNFARKKVPLIVSGRRTDERSETIPDSNQVVLSSFFAGKWFDLYQDKHHRWKLESSQLRQYGLKGLFPGKDEWWEAIRVQPRQLAFLSPTGWLSLCPLICEDLARLDPVSPLIRGVGPSLLIAVLLDGPQLQSRWSARYASVLAEDPGTSVLTVSSLGMALRGGRTGRSTRRTIAMWKDLWGPWKELEIDEDDHGLLLSVRAEMEEEMSLDGRSDHGNAAVFRYQGDWPLRLPPPSDDEEPIAKARYLEQQPVDLEELSRFCQIVDNAIAGDPDSYDCLFGLARGEPWQSHGSRFDRCRYASGLAELIQEELDHLYGKWQSHRADYGRLLDYLRALLDAVPRHEGEAPARFYGELLDLVEVSLRQKALPALPETLREAYLEAVAKIAPAGEMDQRRIPVLTSLAILWSIHRRIVPQPKKAVMGRPRTPLDDEQRRLLRRIDTLLDVDYARNVFAPLEEGDRLALD